MYSRLGISTKNITVGTTLYTSDTYVTSKCFGKKKTPAPFRAVTMLSSSRYESSLGSQSQTTLSSIQSIPKRILIPSGNEPHGWLENPRAEWRFLARKISYKSSIFQQTMFDYRRVVSTLSSIMVWLMFGGRSTNYRLLSQSKTTN